MVARKGVSFISHDKQQRKTAERVQSMTITNLSENVWGIKFKVTKSKRFFSLINIMAFNL